MPFGYCALCDWSRSQLIYEALELNARGQVTRERMHGSANLTTRRVFETQTGRLLSLQSGTDGAGNVGNQIQVWTYGYDVHSNLRSRETNAANVRYGEAFTYDGLDRLSQTELTIQNGAPLSATIDAKFSALGNLRERGLINLTYGAVGNACGGPHAVIARSGGSTIAATYCHDANGNQVRASYANGGTREIDYYGYDLAPRNPHQPPAQHFDHWV